MTPTVFEKNWPKKSRKLWKKVLVSANLGLHLNKPHWDSLETALYPRSFNFALLQKASKICKLVNDLVLIREWVSGLCVTWFDKTSRCKHEKIIIIK